MNNESTTTLKKFLLAKLIVMIITVTISIYIYDYVIDKLLIKLMSSHYINYSTVDLFSYDEVDDDFLIEQGLTIEVLNNNLEVIYSRGIKEFKNKKYSLKQLTDLIHTDTWTEYVLHTVFTDNSGNENIIIWHQRVPDEMLKTLRGEAALYISLTVIGFIAIFIAFVFLYFRDIYSTLGREFLYIGDKITRIPHLHKKIEIKQFRLIEARRLATSYNDTIGELKEIKDENYDILRSSNQLITDLSHDIKSPLTSLTGYTELIKNRKDNSDIDEYIGFIGNSVQDLNNIVSMLFDQIKYRHTEIILTPAVYDINTILRDVCANYYTAFDKKGFEMEIQIEEKPCYISVDKINMKRVFNNLLDNCLKHNNSPTRAFISSEANNKTIIINFMNDGEEILIEDKPEIFNQYFKNKKSPENSSGLGLNIVKEIIEKHGGSIILIETPDYKTVFQIILPTG